MISPGAKSVLNPIKAIESKTAERYWLTAGFFLLCLMLPKRALATTYAYVPNYANNTVSIIQTSDQKLIASIPVETGPFATAVGPMGRYVYVTNKTSGTVSVIDADNNTVVNTLSVGTSPMGIAASPLTSASIYYVYTANNGDNTVSIISVTLASDGTGTSSLLSTVNVGSKPYAVAVDPNPEDQDYVYVSNYGDGTVSVFSQSKSPVTVDVGQGPMGIAIDKNGGYAYVANNLSDSVTVINILGTNQNVSDTNVDSDDNQVVKTVDLAAGSGPWGITSVNSAKAVYVSDNGNSTVSVIDAENPDNPTVKTTISLSSGAAPTGIASPLNGNFAYVVNNAANSISIIDTTNNTVTSTLTALSINGVSDNIAESSFGLGRFIGGTPPLMPTDLTSSDTGDGSITLTWVDNSFDETGFEIERRPYTSDNEYNYSVVATVPANTTTYTDSGLGSNDGYQYRVAAYNEAADSQYSTAYNTTTSASSSTCFIDAARHR